MPPPAGFPNPFSIFGRPRSRDPQPEPVEEDDELDDEYNPNAQGAEPLEDYGQEGELHEGLDPEEYIDESGVIDGDDLEEGEEDQLERDGDEEMHDRGMEFSQLTVATINQRLIA